MRAIRKLFLNRNKVIHRKDGLWEARNDWYGVGANKFETKEEALSELKKGIEVKKAYSKSLDDNF
jgi:hypothetical protein